MTAPISAPPSLYLWDDLYCLMWCISKFRRWPFLWNFLTYQTILSASFYCFCFPWATPKGKAFPPPPFFWTLCSSRLWRLRLRWPSIVPEEIKQHFLRLNNPGMIYHLNISSPPKVESSYRRSSWGWNLSASVWGGYDFKAGRVGFSFLSGLLGSENHSLTAAAETQGF